MAIEDNIVIWAENALNTIFIAIHQFLRMMNFIVIIIVGAMLRVLLFPIWPARSLYHVLRRILLPVDINQQPVEIKQLQVPNEEWFKGVSAPCSYLRINRKIRSFSAIPCYKRSKGDGYSTREQEQFHHRYSNGVKESTKRDGTTDLTIAMTSTTICESVLTQMKLVNYVFFHVVLI